MDDARVLAIADEWARRAADLLYLPILSTTCVIDPDAIFIGGNISASLVKLFCHEVSKRLSISLGAEWSQRVVRPAEVSGNAAAVGAAVLGFRELWDQSHFDQV